MSKYKLVSVFIEGVWLSVKSELSSSQIELNESTHRTTHSKRYKGNDMIKNFYVIGSQRPRPGSQAVIYADGSPGADFREGVDIELSHWVPNRTAEEFKAKTSTEICLKFVDKNRGNSVKYDLAVNNHFDVDGVLSVYSLVHSETALQNREVLREAAEMGDFWEWGSLHAQTLFLALSELMVERETKPLDVMETVDLAFSLIDRVLDHSYNPSQAVLTGIDRLKESARILGSSDCKIHFFESCGSSHRK
jgi:hypothetical protein